MKRNKNIERFVSAVSIVIGWIFIVPLSLLFPRKKGLVVLIGRDSKYYSDNTKYFNNYLLHENYPHAYILFEKKHDVAKALPNSLYFPSLRASIMLLRAEYLIVDTSTWFYNFKAFLSIKAKRIQLWHGVSSKKIEMATDQFNQGSLKGLKRLYGILRGQFLTYKLIASTSDYYTEHLYKNAFRYKEILPLGQSRNDVFFRSLNDNDLLNADANLMHFLMEKKEKEHVGIILYTPTYRNNLSIDLLDFERINSFCVEHNFMFVLKYHILSPVPDTGDFSHVFLYDRTRDVYPLMTICDVMITDYSSIYIDYLLRDKPVLFYIPDFEEYQRVEVGLRNDFYETSPGEKIHTQDELLQALSNIKQGKDSFTEARKQILDLSYQYKDGDASKRLFDYLNL